MTDAARTPTVARGGGSAALLRLAARSRIVRQAGIFTVATAFGSLVAAVSKALLSHLLTVQQFGSFSFSVSLLQLTGMLFEFGLFLPVARLAAGSDRERRRELVGAALVVFLPVGVAFDLVVFGTSFVVNDVFSVDAAGALRLAAVLAFVYPFAAVGLFLAQGVDRLHLYSIAQPIGNTLFAASLGLALLLGATVSAPAALLVRAVALALGFIPLLVGLKPVVRRLSAYASKLVQQAREYGFAVYVGRVSSLGTYQLDVLMLGALTDSRTVGLYALAGAIANAITIPGTGLGNALFGRFAGRQKIDNRWLAASVTVGAAGVLVVWLLTGTFLHTIFPAAYAAAKRFTVPLAIAAALRGVTIVYNTYFSAHGMGRALRDSAYVLTASNVVLNLTLIPFFGGTGAAWASAAALLANLAAHVIFYSRRGEGTLTVEIAEE